MVSVIITGIARALAAAALQLGLAVVTTINNTTDHGTTIPAGWEHVPAWVPLPSPTVAEQAPVYHDQAHDSDGYDPVPQIFRLDYG